MRLLGRAVVCVCAGCGDPVTRGWLRGEERPFLAQVGRERLLREGRAA